MDASWTLWLDTTQPKGTLMTEAEYLAALVEVFAFQSMAELTAQWSAHGMDARVTHETTVRVFRTGIRPLWEAPGNADGGKWLVTLPGCGAGGGGCWWCWLLL